MHEQYDRTGSIKYLTNIDEFEPGGSGLVARQLVLAVFKFVCSFPIGFGRRRFPPSSRVPPLPK